MRVQPFTVAERAMTLAGLAPAIMLGCAVHDVPGAAAQWSASGYRVSMPVPAAAPARPRTPAPAALTANIDSLTRNFTGLVGVAVHSLDEGWTVSANGDMKLPQQSVSKLWVAMTVLDLRDQGRLNLDDPITIRREDLTVFHQPIAALVKDGGYQTTIRELIKRAIQMSDNTCNDRLLQHVGGPAVVRAFIQKNALGSIRFGPGERNLQAATAGLQWKPEYSLGNAFAAARARLPQSVRLAAFEAYVSDPPDGAAPLAIANALARLKQGNLLSPSSSAWLIDVMQNTRTGKARLRASVPPAWKFGHKTGTGQDLTGRTAGFNDVGILTAPDGKSYSLAVMIGDTRRPVRERQELMQAVVAAVVANHRSGPPAPPTVIAAPQSTADPAWRAFVDATPPGTR